MKRYIVFLYDTYYPDGGWRDFHNSYDTLTEAREAADSKMSQYENNNCHVIDMETWKVVLGLYFPSGKGKIVDVTSKYT